VSQNPSSESNSVQ